MVTRHLIDPRWSVLALILLVGCGSAMSIGNRDEWERTLAGDTDQVRGVLSRAATETGMAPLSSDLGGVLSTAVEYKGRQDGWWIFATTYDERLVIESKLVHVGGNARHVTIRGTAYEKQSGGHHMWRMSTDFDRAKPYFWTFVRAVEQAARQTGIY